MAKDNRRKRYKKANKDMICRLPNEILGHSTWKLSFFLYKQWISAAIKDSLEGLILYTSDHVLLPRRIFSCEKLVVLDLSYRIDIDLLGVGVRFPCLKVLHLQDLLMLDDHASIQKLLAGSPVLEALKIEHEDCESWNALRICSSSLKRLIIRFTFIANYVKDPGCRALRMLQPLYSLVETALSVAYEHVFTIQVDDYIDMHGSSVFETDHAYCQELTINLTRLEIEAGGNDRWLILHEIFKCSPKIN
ncbi:hypothetical protein NC652_033745 [Populus alba x Populus x berolinensis]|nr:hypothetical protein NC652_033745 [Populus alba x Populus x berolinensis]